MFSHTFLRSGAPLPYASEVSAKRPKTGPGEFPTVTEISTAPGPEHSFASTTTTMPDSSPDVGKYSAPELAVEISSFVPNPAEPGREAESPR